MVSAKLLQIFATGPQDKILYGNPKITYFKTVYKQHTNFGTLNVESEHIISSSPLLHFVLNLLLSFLDL